LANIIPHVGHGFSEYFLIRLVGMGLCKDKGNRVEVYLADPR
jgi:hypothetical protein